jgi:hypothetical protein
MMGWLSFFNPSAWLQTLGAGVICLALGFGGGVVKGYQMAGVEALRNQIATLNHTNSMLVAASKSKDDQIEADRAIAEANEREAGDLAVKIQGMIQNARPVDAACRLSSDQLRDLGTIAGSTGTAKRRHQVPRNTSRSGKPIAAKASGNG